MVGDLTRPASYKTMLGRVCLGYYPWVSGQHGVNSLVQVQCVVAFKTYSVELLSSETLVCVLVGSHLW